MSDNISKPNADSASLPDAVATELLLDADALEFPSDTDDAMTPPDVVITQGNGAFACSIDAQALLQVQRRAKELIARAGKSAYADFPIDRSDLYERTVGTMLTATNICRTLVPFAVKKEDHNRIREQYNSARLSAKDGAAVGVVGTRIPLTAKCPERYDWENAPAYAGADSCEDVTEEFEGGGIPTVLYSTKLPPADAVAFLDNPANAPFYTRYANDGPIPCTCNAGDKAFFHVIRAWGAISAEFAMRTFRGKDWSAWQLVATCTTPDGKVHNPTDIMFDFGIRVFMPIVVDIDGERTTHTLVVAQVGASSENMLTGLVPQLIPLERFFGGEYAKKVLTEALARGWEITNKK